ncbi:hypothetical protein PHYSODRAFT_327749 [Phytophthora sojae]|uniref:Uncharacterized protein n=1 Tax=Phytophthora sojae (strain P6497) TaxID=1094619 RepID=G4Z5S3_PHYSP|nr:hypothetical protein PHYSODRAFT_327749 [Phytophthora sojae]EGZ19506.1 hypothetical protein PHYSODRAFT_327749 [Phytophthora sojae]|eukprot:XP_009522223.1 hypothetical protein PHYSODRAFT_327749 [Phytophthora sojae]
MMAGLMAVDQAPEREGCAYRHTFASMDEQRRAWLDGSGGDEQDQERRGVGAAAAARERKNALRRERRARQRASAPVVDPGAADTARERKNAMQRERRARPVARAPDAGEVAAAAVRDRKNLQQRERRARQREQPRVEFAQEHVADSIAINAARVMNNTQRQSRCMEETESDRQQRLLRQKTSRQAKVASCREEDRRDGEQLSARVLVACDLTEDEIQGMAKKQHFCKIRASRLHITIAAEQIPASLFLEMNR